MNLSDFSAFVAGNLHMAQYLFSQGVRNTEFGFGLKRATYVGLHLGEELI